MNPKLVASEGSLAVTLPADIVQELGLEKGQEVEVSVHPLTRVITIRSAPRRYEGGEVTARVEADIDALLVENADVYERLAR